jgi:RNA polymerase sigma-B factor
MPSKLAYRWTGGPSDENDAFVRWQRDRDPVARDQLIQRHLPLARKLARRYKGTREPLDDLVQVASLGLVKAIDRYDPERGLAFTTFAVPTIIGELKRYFRDLGWATYIPRGVKDRAVKIERIANEMTGTLGRAPTVEELAQRTETSIEDVLDALEASACHHTSSLHTPLRRGESTTTIADSIGANDPRIDSIEATASIAAAAQRLRARDRQVVALRFEYDCTQTEIAQLLGISQMQVSRMLRRALTQLQSSLEPDSPARKPTEMVRYTAHTPSRIGKE